VRGLVSGKGVDLAVLKDDGAELAHRQTALAANLPERRFGGKIMAQLKASGKVMPRDTIVGFELRNGHGAIDGVHHMGLVFAFARYPAGRPFGGYDERQRCHHDEERERANNASASLPRGQMGWAFNGTLNPAPMQAKVQSHEQNENEGKPAMNRSPAVTGETQNGKPMAAARGQTKKDEKASHPQGHNTQQSKEINDTVSKRTFHRQHG